MADSAFAHIVLGIFKTNYNVHVVSVPPSKPGYEKASYYYYDSIAVEQLPCSVKFEDSAAVCAGDSAILTPLISYGSSYLWNTGSTDSWTMARSAGTYVLTVAKDGFFCTDSVVLTEELPLVVRLTSDTVLCAGEPFELKCAGSVPAMWSSGDSALNIFVWSSGTYWASQTNVCGTAYDSVDVTFIPCGLFLPSAFTPNGDGINDIARAIRDIGSYEGFALSIFNRYGQCVYYSEDFDAGWDGRFNGMNAELGVYFYSISYTSQGKQQMMKGDLTLIR